MPNKNFIHLHTHSEYSLLDASSKITDLINKAKEFNMPAIALTDHGNLFGLMELYQQAKKKNIKAILGCELYISINDHKKKQFKKGVKHYHHLVVLAKNNEGYKNLIKIASIAYNEGFYYRPRIDKKTLKQYSNGLIVLTACLGGEIPTLILNNKNNEVIKVIEEFKECFGENNFFLELQNHKIIEQEKVNKEIINLSKKLNVPLTATNDVHYVNKEDYNTHDALLCISSQKKLNDEKRKRYPNDQFYLKNYEEMKLLFPNNIEALSNTIYIANMCNVKLEYNTEFPSIDLKENDNNYLRKLCNNGLKKKYKKITNSLKERLNYELETICNMGFANYFLIVADFIQYAKKEKIAVGPGRGSAAGSLVSYSLDITKLDPIKYSLLFERFLNPERISMPDIDTDFQDNKREQVIEYVTNKYGKNHVANIITFGTLKARGVIRDVGRILNIPLQEVDKIAKLIPQNPTITLEKVYNSIPDFKNKIKSNSNYEKLFQLASKLEGIVRNASTHAAGIIIGKEKLSNIIPLYTDSKTGQISSQYEGSYLENCGILKMDFLGLKNLTVIQKCIENLKLKNIKINIDKIPLDNEKVYKLLQKGNSLGIFQLESSGMQELMQKLKPSVFEEIIALVALYRPGPLNSGMAAEFIKRKHNPNKIIYPHPSLENLLKETYGVIIYQEQVMEIAKIIAGFTMGMADELRKAMGKKLKKKMESMKVLFIEGSLKNNINEKLANELYNKIAKFGEYGFNKSHSAAYALITYQTAYLKANYPLEYMSALLSSDKDNIDKIVEYVTETKKMNIQILPPSINKSKVDFSVENNNIRFGLSAIKNVSTQSMHYLVDSRKKHGNFESLFNLTEKTNNKIINRKILEVLIKSGACDELGYNRRTLFDSIEKSLERSQLLKEEKKKLEVSLFNKEENNNFFEQKNSNKEEWSIQEKLKYEKEILGFYLSGNPLEKYSQKIKDFNFHSINDMKNIKENSKVVFCALLNDFQSKISKKNTKWGIGFFNLLEGSCEVLFFKYTYFEAIKILKNDEIFYIEGKLESKESKIKIIAEQILKIDEINENHKCINKKLLQKKNNHINEKKLHITIQNNKFRKNEIADDVKKFFLKNKGNSPLIIHFLKNDSSIIDIEADKEFNVNASKKVANELHMFNSIHQIWIE